MKHLFIFTLLLLGFNLSAQRDTTYNLIEVDDKTGNLFKTTVKEYADGRVSTEKVPMKDSTEIFQVYKQSFTQDLNNYAANYAEVVKNRLGAKSIVKTIIELEKTKPNVIFLDTAGMYQLSKMQFTIKGDKENNVVFRINNQGKFQYRDSRKVKAGDNTWNRAFYAGRYLMLRNFDGKEDVEYVILIDDKNKIILYPVGRDEVLTQFK